MGSVKNYSKAVAEARFLCSICSKEAGHIQLFGDLPQPRSGERALPAPSLRSCLGNSSTPFVRQL